MSRFPEISKVSETSAFPDPLSYHRHLQTVFPCPALFSIVTWGCCGSTWLAKVLNAHPEIYCQHAFNQHYACALNAKVDDGIAYLESIAVSAHAYRAAGDVHGISREMIKALNEHFGERIRTAILVRNPWDRFFSMLSDMRIIRGGYSDYSYINNLLEKVGLNPAKATLDQRLFVHATNMLNAITTEQNECQWIFKMEEFTSDPEILRNLIEYITANKVIPDSDWLHEQISTSSENSHVQKIRQPRTLNRIERSILREVVTDEALERYREMGYQVDKFR